MPTHRHLAILLFVSAAVAVCAEIEPVWELGVHTVPKQLVHGATLSADGVITVGPNAWFALPPEILSDQQNYRVDFEFKLSEGDAAGRVTLMSTMDGDTKSGVELRYSPPPYNACMLCVNGFPLFDRRKMLQADGFTKVRVEVRQGRVSFYTGGHLIGTSGPRAMPSKRPLQFGGTYVKGQKPGNYLLRNVRVYDRLEAIPKATSKAVKVDERLDLYLCIGQSNMAGRAPFAGEDAEIIDNCYLLNDDDLWEPARNPLNIHSTIRKGAAMQKMGPGYMFAKTMLQQENAAPIGLIVNAKGGTSIGSWAKGGYFYREILRRTRIAQEQGRLRGIIWHQGESDRSDPNYLDKLTALITALRTDLGEPNLPFIAGQVNDVELINGLLAKLPLSVPSTGVVSSEGLTAMDRWHFDTRSMKLLGSRYAEEMLKLLPASNTSDALKVKPGEPTP